MAGLVAAIVTYTGATMIVALWVTIGFELPVSRPFVFEGLEAFASSLLVLNALWAALVLGALLRARRSARGTRRSEILMAVTALVLLGMLSKFALLAWDVSHW